MCTKRPDNYTLPTMKRETARDMNIKYSKDSNEYRKVASSNKSLLETHAGFFRLLMKGMFDPYIP